MHQKVNMFLLMLTHDATINVQYDTIWVSFISYSKRHNDNIGHAPSPGTVRLCSESVQLNRKMVTKTS